MSGLLDVLLWSLRQNARDVVALYERLSPLMCRIAGSTMLNFGYWDGADDTPALAQQRMCDVMADVAGLASVGMRGRADYQRGRDGTVVDDVDDDDTNGDNNADGLNQNDSSGDTGARLRVLDVGSGLGAPARRWMRMYDCIDVFCINTSYVQLYASGRCGSYRARRAEHANASALALPVAESSVDRIISLESAQHFAPLGVFAAECRRVISDSGILAVAVPVVTGKLAFARLGLLNVTWASAHHTLEHVRSTLSANGFEVRDERLVGHYVYGPLADYYGANRGAARRCALQMGYPERLEDVIAASMRRMKKASDEGVIEYVLMQCRPKNYSA